MSVLENLLVPSAYVVHLGEAEAEAEAMKILSTIGLADKAGGSRASSRRSSCASSSSRAPWRRGRGC